jgi:hypothetical protein
VNTRVDPITKRFLPLTLDELIETYISIEQTTGCWIWMGTIDPDGYGSAKVDGSPRRAHRVVYQRLRGEIPEGLHLDHLCRHRFCVNPDHLEPVTSVERVRRLRAERRSSASGGVS